MGKIAADLVKSLMGAPSGGSGDVSIGGGKKPVDGISGDGAHINHGNNLDGRGVPAPGTKPPSGADGGSNGTPKGPPPKGTGARPLLATHAGPGSDAGSTWESEAFARSALGFSPSAVNAAWQLPSSASSGGAGGPSGNIDSGGGSGAAGGAGNTGVDASSDGAMPMGGGVVPSVFIFHTVVPDDGQGVAGGWQETDCITPVRFDSPPDFPPMPIDVNLVVGVPLRNKKQGKISPRFAQAESAEAANLAGLEVTAMLNAGEISPSQVPQMFITLMQHHLLIEGRRVTSCSGGSKKGTMESQFGPTESPVSV
jgi:hypothetical protein